MEKMENKMQSDSNTNMCDTSQDAVWRTLPEYERFDIIQDYLMKRFHKMGITKEVARNIIAKQNGLTYFKPKAIENNINGVMTALKPYGLTEQRYFDAICKSRSLLTQKPETIVPHVKLLLGILISYHFFDRNEEAMTYLCGRPLLWTFKTKSLEQARALAELRYLYGMPPQVSAFKNDKIKYLKQMAELTGSNVSEVRQIALNRHQCIQTKDEIDKSIDIIKEDYEQKAGLPEQLRKEMALFEGKHSEKTDGIVETQLRKQALDKLFFPHLLREAERMKKRIGKEKWHLCEPLVRRRAMQTFLSRD